MLYARFKISPLNAGFVNSNLTAGKSISILASVAVARALAYKLALPRDSKFDYRNYYKIESGHYMAVTALLSRLNEITVIDFDSIQRFIEALYEFRCRTAFPRENICCLYESSALADFFDFGCSIPSDMMTVIKSSPVQLSTLTNGFNELFKDPVFADCLEKFIEKTA